MIFKANRLGETKEMEFLDKQQQVIEKCLVPVVQAYYSDYNRSLASLTAICDDFRKNQADVIELSKRIGEVKTKMSGHRSGIKDLFYERVGVVDKDAEHSC